MQEYCFEITEEMEDERVDKCLSALIDSLSRSYIQKMVREGQVTVNGQTAKGSCRLKAGDKVSFLLPDAVKPDIEPEDIPLDILYEDDDVIVVNKPAGMVVHPAPGRRCVPPPVPGGETFPAPGPGRNMPGPARTPGKPASW